MARISSFEKFPQAYEAWFDVHKLVYQDEVKTAKALVGNRTNGLEIGIGSGKFALPMGIEVGIEPSGQIRKIAQSKGLTVIDAVAEDLPFEAETFDYAAMITVVCFVDDNSNNRGQVTITTHFTRSISHNMRREKTTSSIMMTEK